MLKKISKISKILKILKILIIGFGRRRENSEMRNYTDKEHLFFQTSSYKINMRGNGKMVICGMEPYPIKMEIY